MMRSLFTSSTDMSQLTHQCRQRSWRYLAWSSLVALGCWAGFAQAISQQAYLEGLQRLEGTALEQRIDNVINQINKTSLAATQTNFTKAWEQFVLNSDFAYYLSPDRKKNLSQVVEGWKPFMSLLRSTKFVGWVDIEAIPTQVLTQVGAEQAFELMNFTQELPEVTAITKVMDASFNKFTLNTYSVRQINSLYHTVCDRFGNNLQRLYCKIDYLKLLDTYFFVYDKQLQAEERRKEVVAQLEAFKGMNRISEKQVANAEDAIRNLLNDYEEEDLYYDLQVHSLRVAADHLDNINVVIGRAFDYGIAQQRQVNYNNILFFTHQRSRAITVDQQGTKN